MDELEFLPDPTTECGVTDPVASEKSMFNVINTLAPSFFIGSFSFLQVTRTVMISQMSSNFGQIGLRTAELTALNIWKNPHRFILEKMLSTLSDFIFDWFTFILAENQDMYKSLD